MRNFGGILCTINFYFNFNPLKRLVSRGSRALPEGCPVGVTPCRSRGKAVFEREYMEECPSGRRSTPGKCVYLKRVSRVRIPFPPQLIESGCRKAFADGTSGRGIYSVGRDVLVGKNLLIFELNQLSGPAGRRGKNKPHGGAVNPVRKFQLPGGGAQATAAR